MPMIPAIGIIILYNPITFVLQLPAPPTQHGHRVTINGAPPLPALVGSTLSFTCNEQTVL